MNSWTYNYQMFIVVHQMKEWSHIYMNIIWTDFHPMNRGILYKQIVKQLNIKWTDEQQLSSWTSSDKKILKIRWTYANHMNRWTCWLKEPPWERCLRMSLFWPTGTPDEHIYKYLSDRQMYIIWTNENQTNIW